MPISTSKGSPAEPRRPEADARRRDDRRYLLARAEEELQLSREAASRAAARAHYRLARAFRERARRGDAVPSVESDQPQPFGTSRGAVICLGGRPADYQKWENLIVALVESHGAGTP